MTEITGEMPIGQIVSLKGEVAGIMLDAVLCEDAQQICCPGVTVQLKTAIQLKGFNTETLLPHLLRDLNSLPDTPEWKKSQK